jgi:hypothetical protein
MFRTLALVVSVWSVAAMAGDKPRIAIQQFKGPKASAVQAQLKKALCKTFTCVKPGESDDETPVDAVVTAQATKKTVEVSVYFDEDKDPVTRELKLKGGKLPATAAKSVASAVREAVASGMSPEDAATAMAGSP